MKNTLIYFFIVFFLVSVVWGDNSDDITERQKELEAISTAIKSLQDSLKGQLQETNAQKAALKSVEIEIGGVQKKVRELNDEIEQQRTQLALLSEKEIALANKLDQKKDDIQAILRLAYKQSNQPLIKLLLSESRPEDLSRHLYYFSALTQNQQSQLNEWLDAQNELVQTKRIQEETLARQQKNQADLVEQEQSLRSQKNKRAQVVANLSAQTKSTEQAIAEKEDEYQKLQSLIEELTAQLETLSLEFPGLESIANRKGQLEWPVDGKLRNRYGRTIDRSGLKWEGWLIGAPEGSTVSAVHGGRVVFADFFKSHGLLLIIDHGEGIWTLYGRNQSLLKDVGSWVDAGDIIAEVGQSGGYSESTLYFEVRKNGEPQNPASWLAKR